jgi:excisionase family DNA binding protein
MSEVNLSGMSSGFEVYLKLSAVRNMLGISRTTLWRLRRCDGLRTIKIGGLVRIRKTDLDRFIAGSGN